MRPVAGALYKGPRTFLNCAPKPIGLGDRRGGAPPKPKLRYTAGSVAGRGSRLRRLAPAGIFDKQIREIYRLAG